jgi:hypothetical protein
MDEGHASLNERYYSRAQNQLVFVLVLGVAAALATGVSACAARNACLDAGTCTEVEGGFCAFQNRVALEGDAGYGANVSSASLAELLRGVCAPGERSKRSAVTEALECVPHFPFPDALNAEIEDPLASSPHMKACGKWIRAGGNSLLWTNVDYRSIHDQNAWVLALKQAEDEATLSPRMATAEFSKFRDECMATAIGGTASIRHAAVLAYRHLAAKVETASSRTEVLRAAGLLAGHHCDGPARVGMSLMNSGAFLLEFQDGPVFSADALAIALHVVDEPEGVQAEAEALRAQLEYFSGISDLPVISDADIATFLEGAAGTSGFSASYSSYSARSLDALVHVHAFGNSTDLVRSYLRGLAAFCVSSLRSQVDNVAILQRSVDAIKKAYPPSSGLGRTVPADDHDGIVGKAEVWAASSVSVSQLPGSTGDYRHDCLEMTRSLFADAVDSSRFDATIPDALYEKMRAMMVAVRVGVQSAVTTAPLASMFTSPSSIAAAVASAKIRVSGAPRGSWAGIARPAPVAGLRHDDGLFVGALKQSRAVFRDRVVELVFNKGDPCDHPPFYDSVTLNAYIIWSLNCSVYFLGMAKRPWLDSEYSDESIASRGMWVVAHELAHLTLRNQPFTSEYDTFLSRYQATTRAEALADVGAALGVIAAGLVNASVFFKHVCQLWCARVPFFYAASATASHPSPNERCDFLYETLSPVLGVTW